MHQYHTYSEIKRQPDSWQKTINTVLEKKDEILNIIKKENVDEVIFTGCGTSFYISIAAALTFQEVTGLSAKAVPASEIFLKPDAVINKNKRTVVIGSSRSGNTTEVVRAIDYVQKQNLAKCLAVTGYPESGLAKTSENTLLLPHIQENSVVMTDSFTNILLALQVVTGLVADDKGFLSELDSLPEIGKEIISNAEEVGKNLGGDLSYQHYIYLGLGANYGLACEGMLKMKEMTQVFSETFNPLEFRHGPISVLTESCRVILLSNHSNLEYEQKVVTDVQKFGANTVVIGDLPIDFESDFSIHVTNGLSDTSRGILYLPYLQFIAYFRTVTLGLDPDNPRNLSQVVVL
jgi:glutamine---fructose-6-phosphate transaminase (isomerizing)